VDLPAAIFPQKNINFVEVLMLLCAYATAADVTSILTLQPGEA
jgi:hypothetical protein